jgi:uncharacterized membrane protein YfcA
MLHAISLPYVVSGLCVGLLVGMTGVGGGSLMTPLLILLFGIEPVTAVGTDLLFASVTKTGGSVIHGLNRTLDWGIVARLAAGSVPAAILTLLGLYYFKAHGGAANALVTKGLAVALLLTAMSLLMRHWLLAAYAKRVGKLTPRATAHLTVLTGAALGFLVPLTSVGAGALGVTALILLYPELPLRRIVGSDIAHAVPLTLVAGIGHWLQGGVNFALLSMLLLGSLPGIFAGSFLVPRLPEPALRTLVALVLVVVSANVLRS